MDFIKNRLNIIIAIICIVLFGVLYVNKINRSEVIPSAALAVSSPQVADTTGEREKEVTIKVHVTGAVTNPGVYELADGSRIVDALAAAGGGNADADLEKVNLAKILRDEMQIKIPRTGEIVDKTEAYVQNDTDEMSDNGSLVNINMAGKSELIRLPGIGDVTAGNIIAYREANGSFKSIDAIKKVDRIGEKTFEKIKDLITID